MIGSFHISDASIFTIDCNSSDTYKDTESSNVVKRLWHKIPPFKFFLIMGLMDGLGNILGLIAYDFATTNVYRESLLASPNLRESPPSR